MPKALAAPRFDATRSRMRWRPWAAAAVAALLAACAGTPATRSDAVDGASLRAELGCLLPTQCVNSLDAGSEFAPLRYEGSPAQGLARLQATLATFAEARIERIDGPRIDTIFTTPIGFRDAVEFRIDAAAQRIDWRSRSLFGLYDFGKNRARMREFAKRFERVASP